MLEGREAEELRIRSQNLSEAHITQRSGSGCAVRSLVVSAIQFAWRMIS